MSISKKKKRVVRYGLSENGELVRLGELGAPEEGFETEVAPDDN